MAPSIAKVREMAVALGISPSKGKSKELLLAEISDKKTAGSPKKRGSIAGRGRSATPSSMKSKAMKAAPKKKSPSPKKAASPKRKASPQMKLKSTPKKKVTKKAAPMKKDKSPSSVRSVSPLPASPAIGKSYPGTEKRKSSLAVVQEEISKKVNDAVFMRYFLSVVVVCVAVAGWFWFSLGNGMEVVQTLKTGDVGAFINDALESAEQSATHMWDTVSQFVGLTDSPASPIKTGKA